MAGCPEKGSSAPNREQLGARVEQVPNTFISKLHLTIQTTVGIIGIYRLQVEQESWNQDPGMGLHHLELVPGWGSRPTPGSAWAVSCFSRPLVPRPCPSSPDARDIRREICNLHKHRRSHKVVLSLQTLPLCMPILKVLRNGMGLTHETNNTAHT